MTAPVPAGSTDAQGELREELAEWLYDYVIRRAGSVPSPWTDLPDGIRDEWRARIELEVLALPAVRDTLAAQETVERVEGVADAWDRLLRMRAASRGPVAALNAELGTCFSEIRAALDGGT